MAFDWSSAISGGYKQVQGGSKNWMNKDNSGPESGITRRPGTNDQSGTELQDFSMGEEGFGRNVGTMQEEADKNFARGEDSRGNKVTDSQRANRKQNRKYEGWGGKYKSQAEYDKARGPRPTGKQRLQPKPTNKAYPMPQITNPNNNTGSVTSKGPSQLAAMGLGPQPTKKRQDTAGGGKFQPSRGSLGMQAMQAKKRKQRGGPTKQQGGPNVGTSNIRYR